MTIKNAFLISFLFLSFIGKTQIVSSVYKIDDLLNRIKSKDTTYVINFWATWCKPCVAELPSFDSLSKVSNAKIILVSLDFKEDIEKKVNPFLQKKNIKLECVLLDEINGNDFINKVDPTWTGAIPATLFKKDCRSYFVEKKINRYELLKGLTSTETKNKCPD
ncbi:MAG: TlpA disulfide reductase family protein [Bacteroidota bacterium]|nr:TlpA disulfide reductase family protein [Bacteroidota bacterium]MDP3143899.1 TlpA disulfide reductase family protein [Bacteroidota bacterium]MDP3558047.1 TlpA disulfide reductase family protein [Bacteroidota bacterium]